MTVEGEGAARRTLPPGLVWVGYAAALLAVAVVGATSPWIKETDVPLWRLLVDEMTSVLVVFLLTPFVWILTVRMRPSRIGWGAALVAHAAGFLFFTINHVAAMNMLRLMAYPLFGGRYVGESDWLTGVLVFEGRKDALTYAALVLLARIGLEVFGHARPGPAPAQVAAASSAQSLRIPHRSGAVLTWIRADDILWVEAAGNYVEIVLTSRRLLQRQSLSVMEKTLAGAGFLRIHRSRLVNPGHVRAVASRGNGDFTLTMANGAAISGSRRWRRVVVEALEPGASRNP